MSICDSCRDPGACCREFMLSRKFRPGTPIEEVAKLTREGSDGWERLPFVPLHEVGQDPEKKDEDEYVNWTFNCPKLGKDGRCTIYESRPEVCRNYEPKSTILCVEFEDPLS